jgi:hypothetical protein
LGEGSLEKSGIFGISKDGSAVSISSQGGQAIVSPDYKWMLLVYGPILLYDEDDFFVRQLTTLEPDFVFWNLDSLGIFVKKGTQLHYVAVPDGEPILVEQFLESSSFWDMNYRWLQESTLGNDLDKKERVLFTSTDDLENTMQVAFP